MSKPDPLAELRAKFKPNQYVPQPKMPDRQERLDATYAPDARKARDVVRQIKGAAQAFDVPLFFVARAIAKVTSEQRVRHGLEEAADAFNETTQEYRRTELQPDAPIGWMGDPNGRLADAPPGTPDHKVALIAAWRRLLTAVNEATKVGITKPGKYRPIELSVDLDDTASVAWD